MLKGIKINSEIEFVSMDSKENNYISYYEFLNYCAVYGDAPEDEEIIIRNNEIVIIEDCDVVRIKL